MSKQLNATTLELVKHQPNNIPILKLLFLFVGFSIGIAFIYEFLL